MAQTTSAREELAVAPPPAPPPRSSQEGALIKRAAAPCLIKNTSHSLAVIGKPAEGEWDLAHAARKPYVATYPVGSDVDNKTVL